MRGKTIDGSRYLLWTLVASLLAFGGSFAVALDNNRTISQFAHTAWGPKDGAPSLIRALAQSTDGYLWLGSSDGLYRFDGVGFEQYQPESGGPLPSVNVSSLLALANGDLWVGYQSRIIVLRNGQATNYTTSDGVPVGTVFSLAQDRKGLIWAATGGGLVRLDGRQWKKVGKDWNFPGKSAHALFLDNEGRLWVATEDTLVFLQSGEERFQPTGISVGQVTQFAQGINGQVWMAETTRSVRPIPAPYRGLRPGDGREIQVGSQAILFDRDGGLWITTLGDGLRHSPFPDLLKGKIKEFSAAVESFTSRNGLSQDIVTAILQDREGNIWVGTTGGLDRFSKTNLVPVFLPFKTNYAVLAAGAAGDAWIGRDRLIRIHEGRTDPGHTLSKDAALYAHRDSAGAIWWICQRAIYRYDKAKYTRIPLPPSFPKYLQEFEVAATEDESGAFWLATLKNGLFYRERGVWHRLETPQLGELTPKTAFEDWMGRAWFGYGVGTIIILDRGKIQRVFSPADSPVGSVRAINGRGRHTWIGGERGLAFFDGSQFYRIVPANSEAFGPVIGVEETEDGSLWLAASRGVIQIPAAQVRQALANVSYRVTYRLFDSFDGLPGRFAGGAMNQKEAETSDGKLWFNTSGGLVWIDPAKILTNTLPPPVSVRSVTANGRKYDSLGSLVLPPRTTSLNIGYSGLSLSVPERVRFRYMLEGVDKGWQDAGTRREAFYTRLRPGAYQFRVVACNNDGIWNNTGATIEFEIAPAWYQTIWFLGACVGIGVVFVFAIYQMRVRQVANAISARFNERLDERTRIARELHDTLLQTIQGSKLVADSALKRAEDPSRMREALEQLSIWLARATTEGRAALNSLRTSSTETNDLAEAFRRAIAECQTDGGLEASLSVMGHAKDMHPIVRDEVYRIGYEAIRNACLHSHGSRLWVTLTYSDELSVAVADNGVGIDPFVAERGKEGHFGLRGMRERAARIIGTLTVTTSANSGTQVKLTVPGKVIYRKITSKDQ